MLPILYPWYYHSVAHHVLSIVSVNCNHSSFVLFYVVLQSLYWSVNAVLNSVKSSTSLLSWYIEFATSSLGCNALCMIISFLVLWSICSCPSLVYFKKGPEYLTKNTVQVFIPLIRFLLLCFFGYWTSFWMRLVIFWTISYIYMCVRMCVCLSKRWNKIQLFDNWKTMHEIKFTCLA